MALGVVRAIRDLGLSIPGDVSLVAHDDVFPWLKPENFTRAADDHALVDPGSRRSASPSGWRRALSGQETEPRGEVWPVDLVVRGSIAAAKT